MTTLEKENTAYSIWAKRLKQSFVIFERRVNRLVFPKSVRGRAKASGMDLGEKRTHSLFSEFLHPPDEIEITCHLLEKHSA